MTEFKNLAVVGQGMYEVLTSLLPAMIHFTTMLTCLVPKLQECYPPPLSLTSNPKCKLKCSIKCKKNKSQWYQNNAPIVKISLFCHVMKSRMKSARKNEINCNALVLEQCLILLPQRLPKVCALFLKWQLTVCIDVMYV